MPPRPAGARREIADSFDGASQVAKTLRLSVRTPIVIGMKLLRYRRPSLRTLTGYTGVKRRVKRELGISQVQAWTKPSRVKQRAKQRVWLYSPTARVVRNTAKGRFPSLFGLFRKK